eukprot:GHVU01228925.1.p1 GENE.GHVU01228925.1~~GHVU01228925.1.p1  ORF type:complete len:103 (+),score=12.19 GHVU01228925.1:235-543(+)
MCPGCVSACLVARRLAATIVTTTTKTKEAASAVLTHRPRIGAPLALAVHHKSGAGATVGRQPSWSSRYRVIAMGVAAAAAMAMAVAIDGRRGSLVSEDGGQE